MKRRIVAFLLLLSMGILMAACQETGTGISDSVIEEYLAAKTEAQQVQILERCSGIDLARQTVSFSWDADGSKTYKIFVADNSEYTDARVYTSPRAELEPDGVFVPGKTYYWKVESGQSGDVLKEETFTVKAGTVRWITTAQVTNVRDLGGWKTEDGKTVRYELLYRGGMTNPQGENRFPEKDVVLFRDVLGIRTEIDLRTARKDDRDQTVSILGEDAPYYKLPLDGYCNIVPGFRQMSPVYRAYSSNHTESIQKIFGLLADEQNYPLYFHCNAGADRTGTVAYLIGGVLGVSYEDLTRDFELTSFSQSGRRWRSNIVGGAFDDSGVMQDDQENYVAWGKMHELITQKYPADSLKGSIEQYLKEACGVTQEQIDSLRSIMLEG